MNGVIKINSKTSIDLPKLVESRLLVQANSGGGKSWAIRRILEQSHGKVQQIIIDSEGEFGTLREKHDYVYVGKGGDVPAEPRSAALLAHKLLETKVSAIVDLYELHPQERKRFVRLFLEAMVDAPKELWHPCLVVIDEAHTYAPEKGVSEAMDAVIGLASKGRKRGYSIILATQRISKLNKDAAAECNNKLIGRASIDIDMKRSAEELGFTTKEQTLSLRTLKPGEFYAFGPAISDTVEKVTVGEVHTSHPKVGSRTLDKIAPPTAAIKKVLAQLADLPQEAEKEARTVDTLTKENIALRGENTRLKTQPAAAPGASKADLAAEYKRGYEKGAADEAEQHNKTANLLGGWITYAETLELNLDEGAKTIAFIRRNARPGSKSVPVSKRAVAAPVPILPQRAPVQVAPQAQDVPAPEAYNGPTKVDGAAKKVYSFLMANPGKAFTKVQLGAITGHSPTSGGFNNGLYRLNALGLTVKEGTSIMLGRIDPSVAEASTEVWGTELLFAKLSGAERAILGFLMANPGEWSKEQIAENTNKPDGSSYSATSGGFNNSIYHLNSMGLINRAATGISINQELLNL